jgi:peroxidase
MMEDIILGDQFFNTAILRKVNKASESILLGLITQQAAAMDTVYTPEVTERLFHRKGRNDSLDLLAFNINRGRDNGMPTYNDYREFCGGSRAQLFSEISPEKPWIWKELQKLYGDIEELDLYVGGLSEPPADQAMMGQTFACIIARQFDRLRRGDRWWYENADNPNPFSSSQLQEIRKITLAKIMCDNLQDVNKIQPLVLRLPYGSNFRVDCSTIPGMNLEKWNEAQAFQNPFGQRQEIPNDDGYNRR